MNTRYEQNKIKQGYSFVIGCDEVGRGSLAGPVVAAAVAFAPASLKLQVKSYKEIKDSKLLIAKKREELSEIIKKNCLAWSIGEVSSKVIDKINIHQATLLAMKKSVEKVTLSVLSVIPEVLSASEKLSGIQFGRGSGSRLVGRDDMAKVFLYIDGKFVVPGLEIKQEAVIGGDNKVLSIAAASIIAKVYRDELMRKMDTDYPVYNFAQHKGYGTLLHRTAILQNGLSPIHRRSFCGNFLS